MKFGSPVFGEAMRFKKARIAISACCGVLCLLLMGLWVRSYWYFDTVTSNEWTSASGKLFIGTPVNLLPDGVNPTMETDQNLGGYIRTLHATNLRMTRASNFGIVIPYWAPVSVAAVLFALPLLPKRFSLRSLLLFTTFISLALGLIIYFTRT